MSTAERRGLNRGADGRIRIKAATFCYIKEYYPSRRLIPNVLSNNPIAPFQPALSLPLAVCRALTHQVTITQRLKFVGKFSV